MEGSVKTQLGTTVCKSGFHQDQATLGGGRPKAIEGRGRWKYQRTSEHLTKKYILVMSFKFSSFNSTNAFYFGLSQKQASLYKLTPSFQGTIPAAVARAFIHCGAMKLLRTRSTMPGLVEGCCGGEARPREPEPTADHGSEPARPDPRNVSLWGTWISHGTWTLSINKDNRLSAQVSQEQMNSVFPALI